MLTERLWASHAAPQNRTELICCKLLQNRTEYDQVAPFLLTFVDQKQINMSRQSIKIPITKRAIKYKSDQSGFKELFMQNCQDNLLAQNSFNLRMPNRN